MLTNSSDDEVSLNSLLPPGFKMKKDVKSHPNETKNRRITRSRKNSNYALYFDIVYT